MSMKAILTKVIALLAGAWRYRWQGLAATWAVCLIGWVAVWSIPDKYAVQAVIYIDTDTALGPLMRGLTVPSDQDQQVAIMLRSITTRPNLEQIIKLVNPQGNKMKPAQMETAVAELNRNIQMNSQGVKNLFSIGYIDNNSAYAEAVTQSLLSILVDSNTGDKRRDLSGARSFIDRKIEEYQAQLRDAETRRANFKAAHLDAIAAGGPGGPEAASGELTNATTDLANMQITVTNLRAQLANLPQTVASDQLPTVTDRGTSGGSSDPMNRLIQAEQQLADLRLVYTDNYPDIIAAKQRIAALEKQVNTPAITKSNTPPPALGVPNPVYVDIRTRLSNAEVQLAILQRRVGVATARVQNAKKNSIDMINIANQYADMDRDYNVLQDDYSQLVKSREAARMSQSMSDQQQSIQYRIIEPPKKTEFPVSPPRVLFNTAVLLIGIAAGVALAGLLSLFGGRFTTSEELTDYFSLPILGVVTVGSNAVTAKREGIAIIMVVSSLIVLVMLYGAVALLLTTSIYTKLGI